MIMAIPAVQFTHVEVSGLGVLPQRLGSWQAGAPVSGAGGEGPSR